MSGGYDTEAGRSTPTLFEPIRLRDLEVRNRVWASPMCQYSAGSDGVPTDWHLVHLGRLALGGVGAVLTEATAVEPEGRISPADTGIWDDHQRDSWARIVAFLHDQGTTAGIQLAHAGRKASTAPPWQGGGAVPPREGGWTTLAPSPIAFGDLPEPTEMGPSELRRVRDAFVAATRRAEDAGFDLIELHAAHGYLLHQFLSPLSNHRNDGYGGDLEARMRWPLEVVAAVREAWPDTKPLLVRVSATDWAGSGEGWELDDTLVLAGRLADLGVDLVDCSSGGTLPAPAIPVAPGYQVPFAEAVRSKVGVATGAVGLITDAAQAEGIVDSGQADVVLLARELLRNPTWPQQAAAALGADLAWPPQYERARPRR
jgi:2,4-dienoyl-CoA reductase-like NADH-dependent reductase (Old Yellow Enzyme family)